MRSNRFEFKKKKGHTGKLIHLRNVLPFLITQGRNDQNTNTLLQLSSHSSRQLCANKTEFWCDQDAFGTKKKDLPLNHKNVAHIPSGMLIFKMQKNNNKEICIELDM